MIPQGLARTHWLCVFILSLLCASIHAQSDLMPPDQRSGPVRQTVERGQDYAIYRSVTERLTPDGNSIFETNQFTLLENALHYQENGEWRESEDLIESFPNGAIARRGPNKAIFSHELNTDAVFDIESTDGKRLRGGVRAIQLINTATGQAIDLGTVKDSVKGALLPPNRIVWRDAFNGIKADVLVVWRHNLFSHDVVLRERPELPSGWDAANSRLEVVTEFLVDNEPARKTVMKRRQDGAELADDVVIRFDRLAMVMGKAFPIDRESGALLGGFAETGSPVVKQWHRAEDGRTFLVESLAWDEAAAHLQKLPVARQASLAPLKSGVALARAWPKRPAQIVEREAIQLAQADFKPTGYLVDFVTIPDQGTPTTLAAGQTYYIKTSYYSGSSVTFEPGCVIKYKNNANMLLYGSVSFPTTGKMMPVFTSRNDDLFGQKITGVANELPSDGDPTLHKAAQAIWLYFETISTTINNARIRWAARGVQYDGGSQNHWITDSLFQNCTVGVYLNSYSQTLTLSNVKQCSVTTPVTGGFYSGSMTADCGPVYATASYRAASQYEQVMAPSGDRRFPTQWPQLGQTIL
jgi:hypothetical protein